jgi:WD40 repeat protein
VFKNLIYPLGLLLGFMSRSPLIEGTLRFPAKQRSLGNITVCPTSFVTRIPAGIRYAETVFANTNPHGYPHAKRLDGRELRTNHTSANDVYANGALYAEGKRLMLVTQNQTIDLWDLQTGRRLQTLPNKDEGDIVLWCCAITPDGTRAFLGGLAASIVWDVVHQRVLFDWGGPNGVLGGGTESMAISPDSKSLLMAQYGFAGLRAIATGKLIRVIYRCATQDGQIFAVALSSNGKWALVSEANRVALCEVATGRTLRRFELYPEKHAYQIYSVGFSPDSNRVLATGFGGGKTITTKVWDRRSGKLLWDLELSEDDQVRQCYSTFTPDGKHLIIAGYDIQVYDVTTHHAVRRFPAAKVDEGYKRAWVTPDGQTVVTLGWLGRVDLWHLATGERVPISIPSSAPQ